MIFIVVFLSQLVEHKRTFEDEEIPILQRFSSYNFLRKRGLLKHQKSFLEEFRDIFLEAKVKNAEILVSYIKSYFVTKRISKSCQ